MECNGFTLTEILVTVAVLGTLSSVSVPAVRYVNETSRANICSHNRNELSEIDFKFSMDNGRYSDTIQELFNLGYVNTVPSCPKGYAYTWDENNSVDSTGQRIPICPIHNPSSSETSIYGNISRFTRYLNLYDSGAILSKISDLSYVPNNDEDTVLATLTSGTQIQTTALGEAIVKFKDGVVQTVKNIYDTWQYLKEDFTYSDDGTEYSGDYMGVGYGYAHEGEYSRKYLTNDYSYNPQNGSYAYNTTSNYSSKYSGASLSSDLGYIYEGSYTTNKPATNQYTYNPQPDGSYTGSSGYSSDITLQYNYGYNKQGTSSQFTYAVDGTYDYSYQTDYSYDTTSKVYKSSTSGNNAYNYDYDLGNNQTFITIEKYDYTGDYTYNRSTGAYSSDYTYNYENGRSFTYNYSYDPSTKTYTYTYTNNTTGETTSRTSRP